MTHHKSPTFIHLRVHTEYSLQDGMASVPALTAAVAASGLPAIALTEQCNLFSVVKFFQSSMSMGVKPIIGADIFLVNEEDSDHPFRFTALCQNELGYKNLTKLISKSYLEGQHLGVPMVQRAWVSELSDGLLILSGGFHGDIGKALLAGQAALLKERMRFWKTHFLDRYYLEVSRLGFEEEEAYIHKALSCARDYDLPLVATNTVCFIKPDDFEAHEARVCIHEGTLLADPRRVRCYTPQQYLRSAAEMETLFSDLPEALQNTVEIAKRCNVSIELGKVHLPNFPVPAGVTLQHYFKELAEAGLEERFILLFGQAPLAEQRKSYDDRLALELDVINKMGFASYFLIVADFVRWSKANGVPVGPGRGSGAGSLVAYALKITDLDPLTYGLLFERFLNPERVSMPDFDIDFCMDGRDRVIEYVSEKYGRECVSQIITYGSMAAKAVVRDVGRVLGHGYGFVDRIAKMIPFELGMTLTKALEEEDFGKLYKTDDEARNLIDLGLKLEGVVRNAGKHAGGVVIAPSPLIDFTPLYSEEGGGGQVSQFDKDDVEAVGLVKFDFLGLRTLTIIQGAVDAINAERQRHGEELLDLLKIDLKDPQSFDLLKQCHTTAVFQLESRGMKDLIKRLQPDCFEDIIALVALFRPGPLQSGMVDDFINCKHGRQKVHYPHADVECILGETYGVILYQEQVMQIAQILGHYSLGAADLLRRAMGKKKPEEMAKQRDTFLKGAIVHGIHPDKANAIFDLMEKFSGYGFNKSHSAAYALIAYQTAWLKAHYPAEFMASVLSSDMDNTDKVVLFLEEAKRMGLTVTAPELNVGLYKFTVNADRAIVYGLGAIKGVGEPAVKILVDERERGGAYQSLFDLCERVDLQKINRRVLEALIKAGALDSFGIHRASLMASLDVAIQAAGDRLQNQASGQADLFGPVLIQHTESYVTVNPWLDQQRLQFEKAVLGFYLSGHPIERYLPELSHFVTARLSHLKPSGKKFVVVGGLVVAIRTMMTKRGDRMAFITLEDGSGSVEMAVFSDVYSNVRSLLVKDQFVIVEGEVSVDDYSGGYKLSCRQAMDIAHARELYAKHLLLDVSGAELGSSDIDDLKKIVSPYRGGRIPVVIRYRKEEAALNLPLGVSWNVHPSDELLDAFRERFGDKAVLVYGEQLSRHREERRKKLTSSSVL